jgi:hypothetical protein
MDTYKAWISASNQEHLQYTTRKIHASKHFADTLGGNQENWTYPHPDHTHRPASRPRP